MLENVKRQVALVIVLVLASLGSLFYPQSSEPLPGETEAHRIQREKDRGILNLNWGNDLAGGTELIYEVDRKKAEKLARTIGEAAALQEVGGRSFRPSQGRLLTDSDRLRGRHIPLRPAARRPRGSSV